MLCVLGLVTLTTDKHVAIIISFYSLACNIYCYTKQVSRIFVYVYGKARERGVTLVDYVRGEFGHFYQSSCCPDN